MRWIMTVFVALIVLSGTGLFTALAAPTTFSVSITDSSPAATCTGYSVYHETFTYTAPADGQYLFNWLNVSFPVPTPDISVYIDGTYDSTCLATNELGYVYPGYGDKFNLTGGTTYTFAAYGPVGGTYDFTVELMPPVSSFSYSAADLTVDFTDMSSNSPNAWDWDFGDGNSSTNQNPSHTYAADGTYNVCLTASNIEATGNQACVSVTVDDGITSSGGVKPPTPNKDVDGDGIPNHRDNCPHAYNPDQEDGWGSAMGDACDTDWYNMRGIGIAGFTQKNGLYHLHGNCAFMPDGDPRCPEIAVFDPATFTPDQMPVEVTTEFAGTWSVWIYYLHSSSGADVYQVNVYSTNPPQPDTLLDDRLEIHVSGGAWKWYQRGGDPNYGGL